jgi:hypothetical protein
MLQLQAGATTSYNAPKRNKTRPRPCTNLDDFDICVVLKTAQEFYMHEKRVPTVKVVLTKLRDTIGYKEQQSSVLKIFKALGFRWRKMSDNMRILTGKKDGRMISIAFLQAITIFRRNGSAIVYSDETYIHSSGTTNTAWSDDTPHGHMSPKSRGQRLITVHAGIETCFIPGTLFIFEWNQKKATIIRKYLVITT